MALIVQKFGGSSLADLECIRLVAQRIHATRLMGHDLVVVVSAMGKETDRLDQLARTLCAKPNPRELDALLATGEQISIALLTMALQNVGCMAQSLTAAQVPIETCSTHNKARIHKICDKKLRSILGQDKVAIVAGFQGIDGEGNLTTLGRGGSDTTAVALAVTLNAQECQIYTDVDGVFTTDPRMAPNARQIAKMTFEEMLELSSLGAKVLQVRAIEFAAKYQMPLRILSTFGYGTGTLISNEEKMMEKPLVSGIAFNALEAKLALRGVPDLPGIAAKILGPLSAAAIEVDMIIQNQGLHLMDFTFMLHRRDYDEAYALLEQLAQQVQAKELMGSVNVAKISLVGVGMRSHAGIASLIFQVLGNEGINIQLISTSEIKISVVIEEKHLELGVRALHEAFQLHAMPVV